MQISQKIKQCRKYLWLLLLWLMFTAGCLVAPLLALMLPFCRKFEYFLNFVKAADRMTAAMLGFSGRQLVSTELIHTIRLHWMREMLDEIELAHCEKSAWEEGAYCRLKDRTLGWK